MSGSTLYIGDVEISVNSEGLLQLPSGSLIDGAVVPTEIGQMTNVRLEPNPEVLEMAVDHPAAGIVLRGYGHGNQVPFRMQDQLF